MSPFYKDLVVVIEVSHFPVCASVFSVGREGLNIRLSRVMLSLVTFTRFLISTLGICG